MKEIRKGQLTSLIHHHFGNSEVAEIFLKKLMEQKIIILTKKGLPWNRYEQWFVKEEKWPTHLESAYYTACWQTFGIRFHVRWPDLACETTYFFNNFMKEICELNEEEREKLFEQYKGRFPSYNNKE
jgi:hypothetical protein